MRSTIGTSVWNTVAFAVIALCVGAVAATPAPAEPASTPHVTVTYAHPQDFTENREFAAQDRVHGSQYLEPLKTYLIKRATRMLPAGDRLDVTITDIKLAGAYEPWHGPQLRYVRMMKDIYPPRIDLTFKLTAADGTVLRQGSRTLRNIGYLRSGPSASGNTDPLRYEKALLNDWLRRTPEGL